MFNGDRLSDEYIAKLLRSIRSIDETRIMQFLEEYKAYLIDMKKYFDQRGKLIYLFDGDGLIIGDIHGDIATISILLEKADIKNHLTNNGKVIFLGDYIDRGPYQIETILFLMTLQLSHKNQIILLRGNHEPPRWLIPYPHDFPIYLRSRYPNRWRKIYELFLEIFDNLPIACISKSRLLMLHGGISVKKTSIQDYQYPDKETLTEILWNDPMNEEGYIPSYRGVGYLFGPDITHKFLDKNELSIIIRGHEPVNGYQYRHNGKIITLFSRLGPPYMNNRASIIKIPLDEPYRKGVEEIIMVTDEEVKNVLN